MPIHDWTRIDAGIFHSFHLKWIAEIDKVLNGGVLPKGYYSLAEQHAGERIPDLLTLHADLPMSSRERATIGATAVLEAPPKVSRKISIGDLGKGLPRTLSIRHVSEHRLVAIIEIVSPGNKDRKKHVEKLVDKIEEAIEFGIHVLILDLFPPGRYDPQGLHGTIYQRLRPIGEVYDLPSKKSRTLASYAAGDPLDVYLEHPTVGDKLIDMPIFLQPDWYVTVPVEGTYQEAFRSMPEIYRDILQRSKAKTAKR